MSFPVPALEPLRLESLRRYDILDTLPEREFDEIVRLASMICHAPIVQINFVDERRQWQKSSLGLPAGEDPRSVSFCAHAITRPDTLTVVEDARVDPRFREYPNVKGEPHIVFYAGAPLVGAEGHAIGTLCVVDRKPRPLTPSQAEALRILARHVVALLELRLARSAADAEAARRAELLARMSHEIRTPLNGIIGTAQLLSRTPLAPEQEELLTTLRSSGEHLLDLANEVLDLAKLEAGSLRLHPTNFRAADALEAALNMLAPLAAERRLALRRHLDPSLGRLVHGDAGRLRQVVLNLVGNALKFTPAGSIHVSARLAPQGNDSQLTVEVADEGPGIPAALLPRLFTRFSAGDNPQSGAGLGLHISREICRLHGGDLAAENREQGGARFTATFRLGAPRIEPVVPPRAAPDAKSHPLRILVAEDNAVNVMVLQRLLARFGYEADVARDGAEAVTAVGARSYDVVFMDVEMPRLDGVEATRRIRARHGEGPVIVACTAHALDSERERFHAAGMQEVLTKPIVIDELAALLTRVPSRTSAREAAQN